MSGFSEFITKYNLTKSEIMECRFPHRVTQIWLRENIIENKELLDEIEKKEGNAKT